MMRSILILLATFVGLSSSSSAENVDLSGATKVKIWATMYYLFEAQPSSTATSVPIRDMNDRVIGPKLMPKTWCLAAIEGSVRIDDTTYNFAGVKDPRQATCSHKPSERVRWVKTAHHFGVGVRNKPLIPFKSLACDLGTVRNSTPWVNNGYAKFGQKIFIPAAKGVRLPDGTTHDGIFVCDDIGGKITGNHIDVFIGAATGLPDALQQNPFEFIKSRSNYTVEAFLLP